jgi:hypothetical protein
LYLLQHFFTFLPFFPPEKSRDSAQAHLTRSPPANHIIAVPLNLKKDIRSLAVRTLHKPVEPFFGRFDGDAFKNIGSVKFQAHKPEQFENKASVFMVFWGKSSLFQRFAV